LKKKSRKDVAKEAAISYFGLSSAMKSFPKGTKVDIIEGTGKTKLKGNTLKLDQALEKIWNDNVGNLSRTARLASQDVAHYANKIGLKVTDKNLEKWMNEITDAHQNIFLVIVKGSSGKKLLMVNTDVTM
jgi:hypothetical protein